MKANTSRRFVTLVLATVSLVVTGAGAATNYVDRNYSGTETGSTNQPFNTIREAVAAANANAGADTILIAAGTYDNALENWSGSGQFEVTNGDLTVRGGYGGVGNWASRTPRATVIDLAGAGTRAFYDNDVANITLDGLTCVNGSAPAAPAQGAGQGGFLYVNDVGMLDRSVVVTNCLFTNNTAVTGGAIFAYKPLYLTISGCDFRGNSSTGSTENGNGGGAVAIGAAISNPQKVENCTFSNNTAVSRGGAIVINNNSDTAATALTITNCTMTGNTAAKGAAVAVMLTNNDSTSVLIYRCVITGNTGSAIYKELDARYYLENCLIAGNNGDGLYGDRWSRTDAYYSFDVAHCTIVNNTSNGIIQSSPASETWPNADLRVRNSIVAFNGLKGISADQGDADNIITLEYNDVYNNTGGNYAIDASAGTGSVSVDPKFNAAASGDYRLKANSTILDSGTNLGITVDLLGNTRPDGAGPAMGCYERGMAPAGTVVSIR
jgi:predicted outer membrane repeat protein